MHPFPAGRSRELEDAFRAFNQMSEQLQVSYRELENRVAELSQELAAARSERLKQLAEKERLANRLEKLLDTLPAGVVVLDGEDRVQDCNPAALDILGEPLCGVPWDAIQARAFPPDQEKSHEIALGNGSRVSLCARSLDSEPGKILLLHDVTKTRVMEETINDHKRLSAMGEMVAGMAHQIRTPLASALLYVSHLGRTDLRSEDRRRFADKVLARLRHMERQVNDMLVFAKGGRFGLTELAVAELLQAFQQTLAPQLQAAGAQLEIGADAQGEVIIGNRDALLGVLLNLATNAIQAGAEGLTLQAEWTVQAEFRLLFRDNGPGMEAATLARVFDPFFTTRPEGTGLGLAVVQAVIHAHQGRVLVESEPGQGTTFYLYLPTAQAGSLASGSAACAGNAPFAVVPG